MPWVERGLLVFGKEVVRVTVEHHFAHQLNRHQLFGNELGRIEDIKIKFELVLFRDQLETELKFREVARFNGFPQIAAMEVWIAPGELLRLIPYQRGFTGDRFPVEAHKGGFAFGVNQPEGMNAKALHGAVAARNAAVGHRPHHVMQGFRLQRHVIPEGIVCALALGNSPVRFRFYGVNKIGELVCVLNKEDRCVVAHQIKNAFISVKLGGETANIAHRVGGTCAALYRGKAYKNRRDFIRIRQEIGFSNLFQAFIRLEIAVCGGAAGVYDALRDTFMVKVGDLLPQDKVFQQGGAARTGTKGVLIVTDTHALVGGQREVFPPLRTPSSAFSFWLPVSGAFMLPGAVGSWPGGVGTGLAR